MLTFPQKPASVSHWGTTTLVGLTKGSTLQVVHKKGARATLYDLIIDNIFC